EIDKSPLRIGVEQTYACTVANVEIALAAHDPALHRWVQDPDISSLRSGAGHDSIERVPDAITQPDRGDRLAHKPLDLACGVLAFGTAHGEGFQLGVRIGRRSTCERGLG